MRAVRGSRVRTAAHAAFFRGGPAPPASPGTQGSTDHTRSSGHGSTVTFRRILCSRRCLCSASTTELSHSRRKVGCSLERSGSLRGEEGGQGTPREGLAVGPGHGGCAAQVHQPPWTTWQCCTAQHPPTPREGATGNSPAGGGQALAGQVRSRALGPQWSR